MWSYGPASPLRRTAIPDPIFDGTLAIRCSIRESTLKLHLLEVLDQEYLSFGSKPARHNEVGRLLPERLHKM